MQQDNQSQLTEQLLALFNEQAATGLATTSQPQLRQKIDGLIFAAMHTMQSAESRPVTIVLSDLRGFTAVAEKYTALEMVEALNRYFKRMSEIIIRHGGTIDKFMGDAIMALFGAPDSCGHDLESALACAIEMQLAMVDINEDNKKFGMAPFYMGIGINTGTVVAGHLGSVLHSEYTVIGDQVNLASRVEAHSLRGQILLSENSYRMARDFIEIGDVNEVKVKGKKGMVRMYELLSTQRPTPLVAPAREIRNSPRVEADMPLVFQVLDGKMVLPQEHMGRVIDISYGGMSIVSPVALEAFSDIKLALSVALLGPSLSEIYAKVLRVSVLPEGFECRVEFTSIDSGAALVLKEFVDGIVEMNRQS